MKKRLLLFTIASLLGLDTFAQNTKQVVVTFNDGKKVSFLLSQLPEINMENDEMSVKVGSESFAYPLYKVRTFTFSDATGVGQVVAKSETGMRQEGNYIIIDELAQPRLYDMASRQLPLSYTQTSSSTVIDLATLPQGTYILAVNGKTIKFTNK